MAEYKHPSLPVKFSLPDKLTVRDQVAFYSAVGDAFGEPTWIRYWYGTIPIIETWECDVIPEPGNLDMDEETDPQIAEIIVWVGARTFEHMQGLGRIPKNA